MKLINSSICLFIYMVIHKFALAIFWGQTGDEMGDRGPRVEEQKHP